MENYNPENQNKEDTKSFLKILVSVFGVVFMCVLAVGLTICGVMACCDNKTTEIAETTSWEGTITYLKPLSYYEKSTAIDLTLREFNFVGGHGATLIFNRILVWNDIPNPINSEGLYKLTKTTTANGPYYTIEFIRILR